MKIRIGTRKSRLALIQTDLVRQSIEAAFPEAEIEIVEMSTKGDELLDRSLTSFGGKGVFTRELEEALLQEEIDLAVHSAKDMPMEFPEGLGIGAVLSRADARDVLVTRDGTAAAELAPGSIVGTSSLRRELQMKALNPLVQVRLLRGNVQTRLRKLKEGQYDAILLAAAGLERLGLTEEEGIRLEYLDPETFLPAAGQGILAVEAKEGRLSEVLQAIHCPEAALELMAERAFLKAIGGSCNAPAAALSRLEGGALHMKVLFAPDGERIREAEGSCPLTEKPEEGKAAQAGNPDGDACEKARALGESLARRVKQGKVWLLGAGPGDTGLLTVKALECIRKADVLVTRASGRISTICASSRRTPFWWRRRWRERTWPGSRAATPLSSGAAARKPRSFAKPAWNLKSFPAYPPLTRPLPTRGSPSPTGITPPPST